MEVWTILQVLILALDTGYLKIIIFFRFSERAHQFGQLVNGNYIIYRIKQLLLQLEENELSLLDSGAQ